MSITIKTVEYVAKLANLKLNNEEKAKLACQMGEILNYMEKLNELDTEDIKPLEHVEKLSNVFRDDTILKSSDREDILSNAPDRDDTAFKVPKVID